MIYALEAARVLNPDPGIDGAVEVASWCDEEGHFGSLLGSRSFIGNVTEADIDAARDRSSGRTMRDALRDAGLAGRPRITADAKRHIGYLEAHIEQGQRLESSGLAIGIVTSIVGIWQYRITFTGEQNHAGTTRMDVRKDAGLALAQFCVDIDERFPAVSGPRTVWTTGRITLDPGAPSIIPGHAEMLFQMRDDDPAVIARLEDLLQSMAAQVSAQGRCNVAIERIRTGAPALMDAGFQQAIEAASRALAGGRSERMPSGAGHDAQVLATIMPAGMLFVPSIGGISHHWSENTDDADIVAGGAGFCRHLPASADRISGALKRPRPTSVTSAVQAGNSPDCFNAAAGLARSFANCLSTAGSWLDSSLANSSNSKGRSEKPGGRLAPCPFASNPYA